MERQAHGTNGSPHPLRDGLGVEFAPKEVPPQVPVDRNLQVAFADFDEDRCLRNGVGGEVVQLLPVMVAERPDESAGGDAEAPLI